MGLPLSYNLRSLLQRKGTTLMTALGIGLTVAVLVTTMALSSGLDRVFAESGHPLNALVMRDGADSELLSTVSEESFQIVRTLPGIAVSARGEPLVAQEGMTVINLPSVASPEGMNVVIRGLLPIGLELREITMVSGRLFRPGVREIIVGEGVAARFPDARIGASLQFGRGEWEVVGIFRSESRINNSEIWADLGQARGDFEQQGGSNTLLLRAESLQALAALETLIEEDQRLNSSLTPEQEYYQAQRNTGFLLRTLGVSVSIIMAVGAAFAATNTMYAAVARRTREIGTLRALGFSRLSILVSFVFEAVCLALIGGVLGVLLALPLNNFTTGVGGVNFAEVAFQFQVTPQAIVMGLVFAAGIGLVGGLFPAWSASRKNIIQAMRDL